MKQEQKNTSLHIRLLEDEKKRIQILAKKAGLNVSEYMRKVALNKEIKSTFDAQSLAQIRKIGVNMNQIARKVNTVFTAGSVGKIHDELDKLRKEIETLNEKLVR